MRAFLLLSFLLLTGMVHGQIWKNYSNYGYLSSNHVKSVTIDKDGNRWFSTYGGGVSKYDGETFTNYGGLTESYASEIAIDKYGIVWVATQGGVFKLEGGVWTSYTTANGLIHNQVQTIAADNNGNIWCGTISGLSRFDGTTWNTISSGGNFKDIAIDKDGTVWLATENGVIKYKNDTYTSYTKADGLSDDYVLSIAIDKEGNKWFGSFYGVSKFDDSTWTTYKMDSLFYRNFVNSIAIDAENNKWFATNQGVYKFDDSTWTKHSNGILLYNSIYCVAFDKNGDRWITSDRGAFLFNNEGVTTYTTTTPNSIPGNVKDIAIDSQNVKWFATGTGVTKLVGKKWTNYYVSSMQGTPIATEAKVIAVDNKLKPWAAVGDYFSVTSFNDSLWQWYSLFSVAAIATDAHGNKWFGTTNNSGVYKFDGNVQVSVNAGLEGLSISALEIDSEGNVWVGTNTGISRFDGNTWTNYPQSCIKGNTVKSIAFDTKGNKWFGTAGGGVFMFDGTTWTSFTTSEGLADNNVNAIAVDGKNAKWFATDRGLSQFNDTSWTTFTATNSGLLNNTVYSIAIDNDGSKWIGTAYGVVNMMDGNNVFSGNQTGIVFYDANGNGKKDSGEINLPGHIVKVDSNFTITRNNGLFYSSLLYGSHRFSIRPKDNWRTTTDSLITTTVNARQVKDTLYFGVQPLAPKHNVYSLVVASRARVGFQSRYWINYANTGTYPEQGTVTFKPDPNIGVVNVSPAADTVNGNHMVWKFDNLTPGEYRQIEIVAQMPGVDFLNKSITSVSRINLNSPAMQLSDTLQQVLTGAYDPNDKQVRQGISDKGYVLIGQELMYTIRFQNTGTDTAFTVNIKDSLDKNMDLPSLKIVGSSHPVKLDVRGQNELTFRFENILLPDSNVNKAGSNGYVSYLVRPKAHMAENTSVRNKALIYFDYNPPVVTNETVNTYVKKLPAIITGLQAVRSVAGTYVYPNPSKEEVTFTFPSAGLYTVTLFDLQGKIIRNYEPVMGPQFTFKLYGIDSGLYFYSAQNADGLKEKGKIRIEK